jgi:hypothetical protein
MYVYMYMYMYMYVYVRHTHTFQHMTSYTCICICTCICTCMYTLDTHTHFNMTSYTCYNSNTHHENQSVMTPSTMRVTLCSARSFIAPVTGSNLPMRGPNEMAPISPANPPTICTTPDPAKSIKPLDADVFEKRGWYWPVAEESGIA